MPRVPVLQEAPVPAPRTTPGTAGAAAAAIGNVANVTAELAERQVAADFERQFQEEKFELHRLANDLSLEAGEDPNPLEATANFEERFNTAATERLDAVQNPRVRAALESELPGIIEPKRVSLSAHSNERFKKLYMDTIQQSVIPGYVQSAMNAPDTPEGRTELSQTMGYLQEAVATAGSVYTPPQQAALIQQAQTEAQVGRVINLTAAALENDDLAAFDRLFEIARTETSALDEEGRIRLFSFIESQRKKVASNMARGLAIDVRYRIRDARNEQELDAIAGDVRQYDKDGLPGPWLDTINVIERRRVEIAESRQSRARVDGSFGGGALYYGDADDRRDVDDYWREITQPNIERGGGNEQDLADATVELTRNTQVPPDSYLSILGRMSQSPNPLRVGAAVNIYERLKEAAPTAMTARFTGKAAEDLSMMALLLKANMPLDEAVAQVRDLRAMPEKERDTAERKYAELTNPNMGGETNESWLNGQRKRFSLERKGLFRRDLKFEGEWPANFMAGFEQMTEHFYLKRINTNTGEGPPLEWAQEQALDHMLVTWGVTGVGARAGQLVFRPPEKAYSGATTESVEEQLRQEIFDVARIGQSGPMLSGKPPPVTAVEPGAPQFVTLPPGQTQTQFDDLIVTTSERYGVPAGLVKAVISVESNFNPTAVSPKGAGGLMQLMPATAEALEVANRDDPAQNIAGGSQLLRELHGQFGNWALALAAYNAGPQAVLRAGGIPDFEETQAYVPKILDRYRRFAKPGPNDPILKDLEAAARGEFPPTETVAPARDVLSETVVERDRAARILETTPEDDPRRDGMKAEVARLNGQIEALTPAVELTAGVSRPLGPFEGPSPLRRVLLGTPEEREASRQRAEVKRARAAKPVEGMTKEQQLAYVRRLVLTPDLRSITRHTNGVPILDYVLEIFDETGDVVEPLFNAYTGEPLRFEYDHSLTPEADEQDIRNSEALEQARQEDAAFTQPRVSTPSGYVGFAGRRELRKPKKGLTPKGPGPLEQLAEASRRGRSRREKARQETLVVRRGG